MSISGININLGSGANNNGTIPFSDAVSLMQSVFNAISGYKTDTAMSLPSFTKSTQISSSAYIQRELVNEDILKDVLNCAQQLYISWVLSAVSLNNVISGTKTTVKDAIGVIASESLNRTHEETLNIINNISNFTPFSNTNKITMAFDRTSIKDSPFKKEDSVPNSNVISEDKQEQLIKDVKLPVGRVVELILGDPKNKQILNVLVNVYPSFMNSAVLREFFLTNRVETLQEKWFKLRTGEYSFIKDFLFELNRRNEKKQALKKDDTGLLQELYKRQSSFTKKLFTFFASKINFLSKFTDSPTTLVTSKNVYNNIFVFNKVDFDRWCKEAHVNFNLPKDRLGVLSNLCAMLVIVIDPDFKLVEMYYHGIDRKSEFTYKQIESQSKKEGYDLQQIMQAFSTTNSPRF